MIDEKKTHSSTAKILDNKLCTCLERQYFNQWHCIFPTIIYGCQNLVLTKEKDLKHYERHSERYREKSTKYQIKRLVAMERDKEKNRSGRYYRICAHPKIEMCRAHSKNRRHQMVEKKKQHPTE